MNDCTDQDISSTVCNSKFSTPLWKGLIPLVIVQKPKTKLHAKKNQSSLVMHFILYSWMYSQHSKFDLKTFRRLNLFQISIDIQIMFFLIAYSFIEAIPFGPSNGKPLPSRVVWTVCTWLEYFFQCNDKIVLLLI